MVPIIFNKIEKFNIITKIIAQLIKKRKWKIEIRIIRIKKKFKIYKNARIISRSWNVLTW